MAETTIEWAKYTFNAWEGCEKVSAGCAHCYAETRAKRFSLPMWGGEKAGGTRKVAAESGWKKPLTWNRKAAGLPASKRPRVFSLSLGDVFEDWQGPMLDHEGRHLDGGFGPIGGPGIGIESLTMDKVRARLFALIHRTPNLDWLLLTKRPENIIKFAGCNFCQGPWKPPHEGTERCVCGGTRGFPDNVWLGTSVENQAAADERIPHLLRVPAKVRFLSCEPLLGLVKLPNDFLALGNRGWVIAGGESGPKARPMHPRWVRSLRDQCVAAGVPFFFKQWGEWVQFDDNTMPDALGTTPVGLLKLDGRFFRPYSHAEHAPGQQMLRVGKKAAGRTLDGRTWDEFPEVRA